MCVCVCVRVCIRACVYLNARLYVCGGGGVGKGRDAQSGRETGTHAFQDFLLVLHKYYARN